MADIATVTSMTKATALSAQSDAAAVTKAQNGTGAPFDVLLQLVAQLTAPANDTGLPVLPNNNANTDTQTDSVSQTTPQTASQAPQDFSSLITLMQSAAQQQPVGEGENAAPRTAAADDAQATSKESEAASATVVLSLAVQQGPTVPTQPQSEAASSVADPASATVSGTTSVAVCTTMTQTTLPQADDVTANDATGVVVAQPATQALTEKDSKPAGKVDRKTARDAESTAKIDAKTASDANILVAFTQQMQAATPTPQSSAVNATMIAVTAVTQPVVSASDDKPPEAGVASLPILDAAANSGNNGDAKQAAASTNNGNAMQVAAGTDKSAVSKDSTADTDAPKANMADSAKNEAPTPNWASSHKAGQSAVQTSQSSPSGLSFHAQPSVTAAVVQTQGDTTNATSVNVNFQVAPKHPDETSAATLDTFGTTIAANSANGIKHFDIRMEPPELGRVEVHLSVDSSGNAQANLVVDKPQTLELLRRDASDLTRSLNDAGVSLSNNGLNFSLRGQDRQNDGGSVVKGRSRALSVTAVVGTDAISNSSSSYSLAPDSVRLDIRV